MNIPSICIVRTSVLVWQLLALQEGIALVWVTKESSISFWQGKVFCHLKIIQTTSEARSISFSVRSVNWMGQEANHLSLFSARVKNVWSCVCCTSTPLYTFTVWFLIKCADNFTLHEEFSCQWVVLLTAQAVVWQRGGGKLFKIMNFVTGTREKWCPKGWRMAMWLLSMHTEAWDFRSNVHFILHFVLLFFCILALV